MIAAASVERPQVRKVRASQGRMPDNVRTPRKVQQKYTADSGYARIW